MMIYKKKTGWQDTETRLPSPFLVVHVSLFIVFEDEAEKQSAGSGSGDKSPAGPPTRPQVGPVASLLGFGRPVARPPTRPAPRPVTRPVARPPAPAGPAGPDGGDNTSTAIGGGSASANNGNAQATGQAIAQAPPGGIALSIGTSIALSTPFGNHAISLGNGIAVGRKWKFQSTSIGLRTWRLFNPHRVGSLLIFVYTYPKVNEIHKTCSTFTDSLN